MNRLFRTLAIIMFLSLVLALSGSAFAANIEVGDTILFGNTLQESLHGTVYGKAPIEWEVLAKDNDKVLLITKQAVSYHPFDGSTWESSSIRSYLNESFYSSVFTDEERAVIIPVTVFAGQNPLYDTEQGKTTTDRVFLLSSEEVKDYFPTIESRCSKATAYVNGEDAFQGLDGNCNWILRTMGFYSSFVSSVFSYGAIDYFGHNINDEKSAIRPALWIDVGSEAWETIENNSISTDDYAVERIHSMNLDYVDEILNAGRETGNSAKSGQNLEGNKDIQKQIQLIYGSMEDWKLDDSTSTVMYSVTDLDHNGRLEIITAENYSSGNYTHFRIWEVNEAENALVDLGNGIDSNFMLTYGRFDNDNIRDDVCAPDVIPVRYAHSFTGEPVTETKAYSLPGEDRIYYTFQNYSGDVESWEQIQECLFLENSGLRIFPVAWRLKVDTGSSRYYDYQGNVIGPHQYADWDSFFPGYQKQVVRLYWLWNTTCSVETLLDSYIVFSRS